MPLLPNKKVIFLELNIFSQMEGKKEERQEGLLKFHAVEVR
jgi:hypothetical protein